MSGIWHRGLSSCTIHWPIIAAHIVLGGVDKITGDLEGCYIQCSAKLSRYRDPILYITSKIVYSIIHLLAL